MCVELYDFPATPIRDKKVVVPVTGELQNWAEFPRFLKMRYVFHELIDRKKTPRLKLNLVAMPLMMLA